MMQPRATKVYVSKMDEISKDFVNKIQNMKDQDNRLTQQFLPLLGKWALESVCYVSLDLRIGLLQDQEDPKAVKFMRDLKLFFEYSYQLDILPSIWKFYKTKTFYAAMKAQDDITE